MYCLNPQILFESVNSWQDYQPQSVNFFQDESHWNISIYWNITETFWSGTEQNGAEPTQFSLSKEIGNEETANQERIGGFFLVRLRSRAF